MTNIFDKLVSDDDPNGLPAQTDVTPKRDDEDFPYDRPDPNDATSDNDPATTPSEIKTIVQELLKHGFIEEANRQDFFRRMIIHHQAIGRALEPLDLTLRIDSHRGVAFLALAPKPLTHQGQTDAGSDEDPWHHPLVRKQRLTLEQSLLVAILRQAFILHEQEAGVGHSPAKIAIEELLPHFLTYFGESGSDTRDENRLLQLLDQLKSHGIVSEVDLKQEVIIRPLIAHLASPESLAAVLAVLKDKLRSEASDTEDE
jgi:hypothetical protein